jgi:6,7-dimethyl-8-ribityllumazine synthase
VTSEFSAIKTSIVIVVSEFNAKIIENLLQGALDAFTHHGGNKSDIIIYRVHFKKSDLNCLTTKMKNSN